MPCGGIVMKKMLKRQDFSVLATSTYRNTVLAFNGHLVSRMPSNIYVVKVTLQLQL